VRHGPRRATFPGGSRLPESGHGRHWRAQNQAPARAMSGVPAGGPYARSVRPHSETVLRAFYDLHQDRHLDWGNVPSWASAGPLIVASAVFARDRRRHQRRQIDDVWVGGLTIIF
jgi:hypothetical protein